MSTTLMQPSHDEIQREVENLRDIKRRSTLQGGPGVLILDPDLPTPGAQAAAAQASYWNPSDDSSSDSHSQEDSSSSDSASDDPFHLFWVPANMHPEIDPAQFRTFLKEHACAPGEAGLARSESFEGASLGRKKSMLSRQYRPSENDGVEDERVVPIRRNRSSLYGNSGPQLTIKDLEKLDELAEEASQSRDPSKLRSVLRRSLSLNMSPSGTCQFLLSMHAPALTDKRQSPSSVIDNLEHAMPDLGDDADAPIIVPLPGQILRRAARTKIRKLGQTGEGAHRFKATRRGAGAKRDTPSPVPEPRTSSDLSTSDHSDAEPSQRQRLLSNESLGEAVRPVRPESYSAESFIIDAYARDDVKEAQIKVVSPPSSLRPLPRRSISPPPPPISRQEPEPIPPLPAMPPIQPALALPPLQHPFPQRASSLATPSSVETPPSRTPSPVAAVHSDLTSRTRPEPRPVQTQSTSPPSAPPVPQGFDPRREKDKDKRGLFKWGGGEKKGKKDQREKEKDAGFFGSLFGSRKKQEEIPSPGLAHGHSGREAAVALLGESKSSRVHVPPASPQPPSVNNYSRYPIHVERAIYRLSHIKLANPRRALYEQVLISNLMFWYLGVINKTQQSQTQTQSQSQQQAQRQAPTTQAQAGTGSSGPTSQTDHEEEREELARTGIEQADKEREPKPATQGQGQMLALAQPQAQVQQMQQTHGRRGSLTKGPPPNASPRRAEQPVRGPQYDMQHRAMEQEYGAAFVGGRPAGAAYPIPPGAAGSAGQTMPVSTLGPGSPPSSPHMHGVGTATNPTAAAAAAGLPPGLATSSPSGRSRSPPPIRYVPPPPPPPVPVPTPIPLPGPGSPSAPNSPVQQQGFPDSRPPMRSMSANATSPLGGRGPGRKAISAHAVPPPGAWRPRTAENVVAGDVEEDVPLALWQQQQQQSLMNQQPRRR